MRILAISRAPWRNDNSIGNTFTDLFQDIPNAKIYSLCMREQPPQNDVAERHFYISEKQMVRRLLGKKSLVGQENSPQSVDDGSEITVYDTAKKYANTLLLVIREMLWSIGGWENEHICRYIDEVHPDILFFPVFGCYYPHKVLRYIHSMTDAKIVLFHADDNYSLKQYSLSPFFWLYRFGLRKWVRRSVRIANLQYCISDVQKADYERAFDCECKLLTKFADFSGEPPLKNKYGTPLQLVFTGNININRWKSLEILADVLERINDDGIKAQLRIYTATPLTKSMKTALSRKETSFLMGSVPATEIPRIQSEADILVHAEGTDMKSRLAVRQSFSTKIVDYLKAARTIIAIGPKEAASIKHLLDNNCAIVAANKQELYEKLNMLIHNEQQLHIYATRAYLCGRCFHDKNQQLTMLQEDLNRLTEM